MSDKSKYIPKSCVNQESVPFENALEAWFWFITAQQARVDGARFVSGLSATPRPCEPGDILNILNRLYRSRRLSMDHLLVLRHYGRRQMAPDPNRSKEVRAHKLWEEAFERLEPMLIQKKIVRFKKLTAPNPNKYWIHGAVIYDQAQNSSHIYGACYE